MADESIDYNKVIADLEAKRSVIDGLLEGFKKLQALGGASMGSGGNVPEEKLNLNEIPSNHFLGMNIGDAAITLLAHGKQPLSTRTIAETLERGGFRHTSQNFTNTVNTALYRLAQGDDPTIVRVGREWGLREWYPGWRRRTRGENTEETVSDATGSTPS